jgi:hypothetical protein
VGQANRCRVTLEESADATIAFTSRPPGVVHVGSEPRRVIVAYTGRTRVRRSGGNRLNNTGTGPCGRMCIADGVLRRAFLRMERRVSAVL